MSIFVQKFNINPVSIFRAIFDISVSNCLEPRSPQTASERKRKALVKRKVRRGDSEATRVDPPANRTRLLPTDAEPSLSIPEDPPLTSTTEERESVRVHNHTTMLEKWRMAPFMTEVVEKSGLMPLVRHSYKVIDSALVLTFIERWQPATCTFHLPFGEMTITLDDVSSLTGLPVVGRPVFIQQISKTGPSSQAIVKQIIGVVLDSTDKCWGQNQKALKLEWLRSTFSSVTDSDDENKKTCKTGNMGTLQLLCLLEDLDNIGTYAWGTACLCLLYEALSDASRANTKQISRYLTLLQGWIYEHFPRLTPTVRSSEIEGPLVTRWVYPMKSDSSDDRARDLRTLIDDLSSDEIIWAPYEVLRDRFPMPESTWFSGMLQYMCTLEPYHPDRVLRQFGRVQKIPGKPYM
ncbi:PREDICTED: serine/threonine-protein phosphatase 7 long form homolog [Erythranthe guttata]|uniref:serine/threonine-protein phosphatase 7 long form homolog n=1 Tax=Erythranthe guttata TaxID=4155 RepID=UPI00064D9B70|nr:PREDICTED: serine/threonine-protein phosphatase 7 long form homolog [Erythranthe guttata]|eukprot:XP_012833253.1 PREDICTED: serine/threonine-protein phosphatase 7 long form homolog [Erythranthe guttata]